MIWPIQALLAIILVPGAHAADTPKLAKVASARAYAYNINFDLDSPGWCDGLYRGKGEICGNASQPVPLSLWQLRRVKDLLTDSENRGTGLDKCWNPRHGVELLDKAGKRVGYVDLSLECDHINSPWTKKTALSKRGVGAWRALMRDLGLRTHLSKAAPSSGN
jgi:hypothetical protein